MQKKTKVSFIAIILFCSIAAWYFISKQGVTPTSPISTSAAITITSVLAAQQDVPIVLQANGTVVPLGSVDLHPQTTSTIKTVHIKEGHSVHVGDLLFTLDDRAEQANLEKAQAQLVRDQAALSELDRQYKRSQELFSQTFISQSAFDTVLSQVNAQRALLKSDEASIKSARVAVSYALIRAPMTGRAGAINVFPGSLVQEATPLVTITRLSPISVSFTLPESSLQALLSAQNKAQNNPQRSSMVPVQVSIPNVPMPIDGVLSFIDNSIDPQAGTLRVKAQFDNKNAALWPGQYVNARITVRTMKDAIVIPQAAIVSTPGGKSVYTIMPDDTVKEKTIDVLYAFDKNAVVSGISSGEKIITEGKQNLRPGSKVRDSKKSDDTEGSKQQRGRAGSSKKSSAQGSAK